MWDNRNKPPRVGVVATMAARNNTSVKATGLGFIGAGGEWGYAECLFHL